MLALINHVYLLLDESWQSRHFGTYINKNTLSEPVNCKKTTRPIIMCKIKEN